MGEGGTDGVRRALVLTGGPAVGKTSTRRALAQQRPRAAFVDVDDVRQLVVSGHEVWGPAGDAQRLLGARNACAVARNLLGAGFDVALADVLTPVIAATYRRELPGVLLVHLVVPLAEARRRAATRPVWLTDAEFDRLHEADTTHPPPVDHRLDVALLSPEQQRAAVERLWTGSPPPHW